MRAHESPDWESFAECASVWQNIGKACDGVAQNLKSGNASLDATWDGNAADAAYNYFDELAKRMTGCRDTLNSLHSTYEHLAHAAYSTAEAINGVLGGIIDGLIIVGIELAAGTALSWTGAGALVGYGLAALQITRLIKMWGDATQTISQAQTIVNGGVGILEQLGAEIYGHFQNFPSVGGNYDNSAVA
ncbi:WXG100 family type VII secretion target [Streptomyces sp. ISL-24]|uniref:WXG100 family type VII secretion target n=1 Tax=Streptomyces sp. ISL-24 TaxID=2819181 RepID=UPI0027E2C647|nr:WXG100 family type VII secretion target [Streptomyces sp. ISL-24]